MHNHSLFMNKSGLNTGLRNLRARINPVLIALVLVTSLIGMNHTAAAAVGPDYYVNNTVSCNDSNSGLTPASPFCTIGRAAFLAVAGDTIHVVAGTYPETVEPRFSGTAGNPITFSAGSGVTVTGDGTLTGSAFRLIKAVPIYVTINGFHIGPTAETGIYVSAPSANVIITNNTISGTASHGIYVLSADTVTVSNNTVSTAGGNAGIYLKSVTASTVSGNTSHDNSADGIRLNASTGITVSNNTTYSNLTAKANGIALILASNSNTILDNTVYTNRDTGIQVDDSSGNVVVGNLSYHNGDHGLDITSSSGIAGSPNTVVVGNTFQGNYTSGINVETNSSGGTILNNIVADNGQTPAAGNPYNIHVDATSVTGTMMDYNLYWMTSPFVHQVFWNLTGYDSLATFQTSGAGQEAHGVQGNPLFVSPAAPVTTVPPSPVAAGDYHLSAGSPAIDSANSNASNEQLLDIQGSPRVDDPLTTNTGAGTRAFDDRGAYEYQVGGVVAPTVTTQAVTSIGTTTATGNGSVTILGVPNPTQHGVAWGTSPNPTISGSHTSDGSVSATGAFISTITGLTPGTLYHVRAYATNSPTPSYGNDVTFTALKVPTVTTQPVTAIGTTTATGNGNVTVLGVPNPTQHGVAWGTVLNPSVLTDSHTSDGPVSATGAFTSAITGISGGTLYHVRAYATNDAGTSYGSDVTFSIPVASTTSVNCGAGTAVVTYGTGISCVVTVTRSAGSNTPSGSVSWTTGGTGSFTTNPCSLVAGAGGSATCSVTYTPSSVGTGSHLITATYAGDTNVITSNGNQSVTVNTAAVTPVITAASKIYDGNLVASILTRSLTGIIGADNVTITGGAATFDTKAVGTGKTVTGTGFTFGGAQVANYHLASPSATTTANIAAKTLTITGITANNKVYDRLLGTTLAGTAAPVGVISGDTVTIAGSPSASFLTGTVGNSKPVTVSGYTLGGLDAANYSVSQPAGLTANITPLGLTVSGVVANDKVYNANNTATLNTLGASLNAGVISPDAVSLNSSLATATFADKNVGSAKPVTALGFALAGADSANYSLAQPTGLSAAITQFTLTASATADPKPYDSTTSVTVHMSTNKFGADDVTAAFTGASFSDANSGVGKSVSVTGITISGTDAANYHLFSTAASTTATISPAAVTVTANSRAKHSLQAITFAGTEFTIAPTLFGSDTLTSVTLTSTGAAADALDGAYPIVPNNPVVGSGLSNYALSFVNGTLTVSPQNSIPSITEGTAISRSMSVNGKPTAFGLTLHATDVDLDPITWSVSVPPSVTGGTASASGTGTSMVIGYVPAHNFAGSDHFTVQVSDGFGGSASIVVNVTITRPSLTVRSLAALDGQILETAENSNVGGALNSSATIFNLGDDAANRQYRAILSFNTGPLPDTAVITSVMLRIKQQSVQGANPFLTMGNLLVDIQKGNFGLPALQAADFQTAASKNSGLTFLNNPVSGWYTRGLAAANFAFVNKVGNTQFRLHFMMDDNNNRVPDYLRFYSGNAPLASQPVLIIQYYVP